MRSSDGKPRGPRRPGQNRGGPAERQDAPPDHRRLAVAAEAARILQEEGITDFRAAKAKAAERLGLGRNTPLPDNVEIEAALAERGRIFLPEAQPLLIDELRLAALEMMEKLAPFNPRLVGHVLRGTATPESTIELHLFADTVEEVAAALDDLGLPHRPATRRQRFRRDEVEEIPGCRFLAGEREFLACVYPLRMRGQAPLSPVDGRPMQRAGMREVAGLLPQRLPTST